MEGSGTKRGDAENTELRGEGLGLSLCDLRVLRVSALKMKDYCFERSAVEDAA
jgi:hypothetical protein